MATSLLAMLGDRARAGVVAAFGPDATDGLADPLVLPARDARHGDYSCSAPMALAKRLRERPLALAERLAAALDVADVCEPPEVAPPGFVNLRLRTDWLAGEVGSGPVAVPPEGKRVVVDYSAPNLAKEMHVGHLRSTVIGDALANVEAFVGNRVDRVNHVGDWGTQFGLLIAHREEVGGGDDLLALYRAANQRFKTEEDFAERARGRVVDLQSGEGTARAAWSELVAQSRRDNGAVYDLLGVHGLEERGESFYEPMLPGVVADLDQQGLLVVDDGARCVFVDGFRNKDGDPLPLIVQKADGGYNYATTDLAALRHRVAELGADRILYVVDAGQSAHLEMVFAVARMAGWVPDGVEVRHVPFGLVLGEDGRRLRTRSGENVPLTELLGEAVARARAFLVARAEERGSSLPEDVDRVARVVGIGAVKYADLSGHRSSNYEFSFDRMLSLKGNTAPYLQYAYARIASILAHGAEGAQGHGGGGEVAGVDLVEPDEVELAKRLVAFPDVLARVVAEDAPNHLCAALFELSGTFNGFYERCPVLRADPEVRASRLVLCRRTAETLRTGLALLGIEVVDRI